MYVVRHGQTTENAAGIVQGPRIDGELSDLGHFQAARLADAIGDVDVVYTSPMLRARATAQAIVDRSGGTLPLQVAPEMYEVDFGDLIGRPLHEVASDLEQVLDAWSMGFSDTAFPGGESAVVAQHRIRPLADRLRRADSDVAVVGHGRINAILVATLTQTGLSDMARFIQDNAAITELDIRDGAVTVVRTNDTSHLGDMAGAGGAAAAAP